MHALFLRGYPPNSIVKARQGFIINLKSTSHFSARTPQCDCYRIKRAIWLLLLDSHHSVCSRLNLSLESGRLPRGLKHALRRKMRGLCEEHDSHIASPTYCAGGHSFGVSLARELILQCAPAPYNFILLSKVCYPPGERDNSVGCMPRQFHILLQLLHSPPRLRCSECGR
jgi:hypothetical protein